MRKHQYYLLAIGAGLLLILLVLSLGTGAGEYGLPHLFYYFFIEDGLATDPNLAMIITTLRLPRTVCAVVVALSLSLAASLLQSATRNPLAEPGLLGVNAGAVLLLVIGMTWFSVESVYGYLLWSGVGALLGNIIVLGLGMMLCRSDPLKLILIGVALSAVFGGLSSFLLLSNQMTLEQFRFWNLGSLAGANLDHILTVVPFVLLGGGITLWLCRQLTLMQMGELQARALGINPNAVRVGVLLGATLFTASAIAIAGPIGFIGFLAAYCGRLIEPVKLSLQFSFSALFGILFMLLTDIVARWVIQPFELANGVILALIGAPVLIVVVSQRRFQALLSAK